MHKNILLALLVFAFSVSPALAGSAKISWNANTESDLAGYRIYYGTSARTGSDPRTCTMCGYTTKVDAGKVTTYTINNLTNGTKYYFSVSAYDTSGNESPFSSEVSKTVSSSLGADLNSDGRVNIADAGIMMSYWGSTTKPAADINQNGVVDISDAGIMMSQWTS